MCLSAFGNNVNASAGGDMRLQSRCRQLGLFFKHAGALRVFGRFLIEFSCVSENKI